MIHAWYIMYLKKFSQYDNIHYWVMWMVDLFEIVLILILFVSGEYRGSKCGVVMTILVFIIQFLYKNQISLWT